MRDRLKIESEVQAAQLDSAAADRLIDQYMPFIRSETAKFLKGYPSDGQDELSIAMFAFYECILAYQPGRGSFLHLAATAIRNRLIDYTRKEQRHRTEISLEAQKSKDDTRTLGELLASDDERIEELPDRMASQKEIGEFARQLQDFGISLSEVADNCPRQERTMSACMEALEYARKTPELLDQFVKTKKLPLRQLVQGAGVERKTIERHRKYVAAIFLAYTNGYEMIRGHLCEISKKEVHSL